MSKILYVIQVQGGSAVMEDTYQDVIGVVDSEQLAKDFCNHHNSTEVNERTLILWSN